MQSKRWVDGIIIITALWLAASPWIFGYANIQTAVVSEVLAGLAVVVLAAAHMARPNMDGLSYALIAMGIWIYFSSFMLGYSLSYWPPIVEQIAGGLIGILGIASAIVGIRRPERGRVEFASAEPSEEERKRQRRLYGKDRP